MSRPNKTPARPALALVAAMFLVLTVGCAEVATEKASEPRPTATTTPTETLLQSTLHNGLWTTVQTCAAITADDAKDLTMILSFMEAQPPDMDHVVAAETVANDFHELGEGTEGPVGEHLIDLANEVLALVAELWEAGDDWVVDDGAFDLRPFDDAVVGLGEECTTTPQAP